ncbi:MAG TPA: hypothetical protein VMA34_14380 [Terracidiphilus sp.]|nr:hypothetical protein [Terracidiphilus sp.]
MPPPMTRRHLIRSAASAAATLPLSSFAQSTPSGAPAGAPDQNLNAGSGRAAWMQDRAHAWGVMTHYLADWQSRVHNLTMTPDRWNKLIDNFDVEAMAQRLASVGAGHYQISIGQNSGYYLSPNPVYDRLTGIAPTKCSRRDLVADLCESLSRRSIRLMLYLPSGAPAQDGAACQALGWLNGAHRNRDFQLKWQQIIEEWSRRWGTRVSGWWFDGCYFPNSMYRFAEPPNFASFAAAARAGNPGSALAFNPAVYYRLMTQTAEDDYIAGEIDKPDQVDIHRPYDGLIDGAQIHMLSFLGQTWGRGTPRFTTDQVVAFTQKLRDHGGSVTWDVPVELDGTITAPFLDQLAALGKAFPKAASL